LYALGVARAIETDFWALGMAIQCYEAAGDIDGAKSAARRCLERVEKAIVAEPDHGLALGWGVSALVALNEVDRAKEWTARARLLDPDNRNLNKPMSENDPLLPVVRERSGHSWASLIRQRSLLPARLRPPFCATHTHR
jgi:tetratricopeptide (TPR) repeat protein